MFMSFYAIFSVMTSMVIIGLINYGLNGLLYKKDKLLIFLIPGFLLMLFVLFLILGLEHSKAGGDGWTGLGYIILLYFSAVGFVSTLASSLLFKYFQERKRS